MYLDPTSTTPIFLQIATALEDSVLTGIYPEESQVPSTTEWSAALRINPATVLKGMTLLTDEGILYKKRGIGMFVTSGACEKIKGKRQEQFYESYIRTLVSESRKIGLSCDDILPLIQKGFENE